MGKRLLDWLLMGFCVGVGFWFANALVRFLLGHH